MDRLLPDTASSSQPPVSAEVIKNLIAELGDDDYRVREAATKKLVETGRDFKESVLEAARSDDPEVRFRANRIIESWKTVMQEDVATYVGSFRIYAKGIKDKERVALLARRTLAALKKGMPDRSRRQILTTCLRTIVKSQLDEQCNILRPLLKRKDVPVALFVTGVFGSSRPNVFFPSLLLDALQSEHEAVVREIVRWTPNCWDNARRGEVKRLLQKIFKGDNEALKSKVSFTLMHTYGDKEAVKYLLKQTQNKDRARAVRAIGWLGDACNTGKPAYPELLKNLVPFLNKDDNLRRVAASALGTYAGEEVVKNLIPLLGDKQNMIAIEAGRSILGLRDKAMLRRLLGAK
ncbi:MAG: HEAT repeat domain-containing protein, partial [Planctomycetia bacterium]|nr:HEAT repeat domain-containing protein [Planctomycetia bacterium]